MILIDVYKLEEIKDSLGGLQSKVPVVLTRALNRTAENVKTNAVRKAREEYHVRAKDVSSTIKITKAARARLQATISSKDTGRSLIQFKVTPATPRPKKPPAVLRVAVKKDGYKDLKGAFVGRGIRSKVLYVLDRVDKKRYPIQIKYGPAVPQMLKNEEVRKYIGDAAMETFDKRIDHEIERLLRGAGR